MQNNDEPDLFPDLPRVRKKRVSYGDMLTSELRTIREVFLVTTPHIAERVHVPSRTMEGWVHGRNLPPEWSARLVLAELRKFFPR